MIKVCVIGGGAFGTNHLRAFKQMERKGEVKLLALADVNEEILKKQYEDFGVKGYTDFHKMLDKEKPDAVSIATPDHLHKEIALEVIERGLPLLVEKPLDVTVQGAKEINRKAQEKGVFLQVDFHKRYDPYHKEAERIVKSGRLGEIQYGYVMMEDVINLPRDCFPNWASKSSPVWFLGVHFYDLLTWIIRKKPVRVVATGIKRVLNNIGIDTYDSVQAKVEYEDGISITFDTSWILPEEFEAAVNQEFRLVGDKGMIEVDSQYRGMRGCFKREGMKTFNLGFFENTEDKWGNEEYRGYGFESIMDFIYNLQFLQQGGKIEELRGKVAMGEDGVVATSIAAAVMESVEKGGTPMGIGIEG